MYSILTDMTVYVSILNTNNDSISFYRISFQIMYIFLPRNDLKLEFASSYICTLFRNSGNVAFHVILCLIYPRAPKSCVKSSVIVTKDIKKS